jgi:hypothetical protein
MKEMIGLAVLLTFAGTAIFLSVRGQIGSSLTAFILLFSLLAGWTTANYDWVARVRWEVPGLDSLRSAASSARQQTEVEKATALEEIAKEEKRSIEALVLATGEAQQKVGTRLKELQSLLDSIEKSQETVQQLERKINEDNTKNAQLRDQVMAIHAASCDLALSLTRVMWLHLQAKGGGDSERAKAAVQRVLDGLDDVVNLIIVEPEARSKFVSEVLETLPSRK